MNWPKRFIDGEWPILVGDYIYVRSLADDGFGNLFVMSVAARNQRLYFA